MRVLIWNLFHGRADPPAGADLEPAFTELIAAWDWDVALLQEVPPWWPRGLARASRASMRMALTSRNELLPARRAFAQRWPDVIKAGGGGCNVILVRTQPILAHRRVRLRWLPERRIVHGVQLGDGTWLANLHAEGEDPQARRDVARAAQASSRWAAGAPLLLGGDFNLRRPRLDGFTQLGGLGIDFAFGRGWVARSATKVLERGMLSDHAALAIDVEGVAER